MFANVLYKTAQNSNVNNHKHRLHNTHSTVPRLQVHYANITMTVTCSAANKVDVLERQEQYTQSHTFDQGYISCMTIAKRLGNVLEQTYMKVRVQLASLRLILKENV